MSGNLVHRFIRWVIVALAVGVLLYVGGTVWAGFDQVSDALEGYAWWTFGAALVLTLVNYVLRFFKWHYLVRRLGAEMPFGDNAWTFFAGLSMTISPGKVGELLKPYVVRERTGTPMVRLVPALVTERLTDGIGMLILASISVSTYAADQAGLLAVIGACIAGGLGVLASQRLSLAVLHAMRFIPGLKRLVPPFEGMYLAMRTCVAPVSLLVTVLLSIVAWGAECLAFQLVLQGLGAEIDLDMAVFIYAFASLIGIPAPGGLGVSDGALFVGSMTLVAGITEGQALAGSLLVRVATLWFGVGLGAIALLRVSAMLGGSIDADEASKLESLETPDGAKT